jgi:hypothetical protein
LRKSWEGFERPRKEDPLWRREVKFLYIVTIRNECVDSKVFIRYMLEIWKEDRKKSVLDFNDKKIEMKIFYDNQIE